MRISPLPGLGQRLSVAVLLAPSTAGDSVPAAVGGCCGTFIGGETVQHFTCRRRVGRRLGTSVAAAALSLSGATLALGSTPALASGSASPGITTLFASDAGTTGGYGATGVASDPTGDILTTMSYSGGSGSDPGVVASLGANGVEDIVGPGSTTIGTSPVAASSALLEFPSGIVFDPTSNNYYIADAALGEVFEYSPSNDTIWLVAGGGATTPSVTPAPGTSVALGAPWGLAVDSSGDLFISDGVSPFGTSNDEIEELTPSGNLSVIAGGGTSQPSTSPQSATTVQLDEPFGLAADSAGNLYVADAPDYVTKIDLSTGELSIVAGGGTSQPSTTPQVATGVHLDGLTGMAIGPSGDVYVAAVNLSAGTSTLLDLSGGELSVVAGGGSTPPPASGTTITPTSALLVTLAGIAVDPNGQLYTADEATGDVYGIGSAPAVTAVSPASGATGGNDTVTITGSGLGLATAVHFGKTAAAIKSCSATSCVVTAPTGSAGTVEVTVSTPFGTSAASSASKYTYVALPTTTVLKLSSPSTRFGAEHGLKLSVKVSSTSGTPTGTVTVPGTACTIHLAAGAGSCTLGAKSLAFGLHSLVAEYAGGGQYGSSSSSSVSLTVYKALTTISLKATKKTLVYGKEGAGHLVVSVHTSAGAGDVTGEISLHGVSCTKSLQGGTATCPLGASTLGPGTHLLTASFDGSKNFASSTSATITVVVKKASKAGHGGGRHHGVKKKHHGRTKH